MNLVMTLLWTRRPLTRHELRRTVEQYRLAPNDEAYERMFERDKDELRALGVPLETVEADPLFEDEVGYRIRPDEYVLPEIPFEADELVVLGLAARTWSHGTLGGAAAQALRKLQATQPEAGGTAAGPVEPRLGASEPTFPTILQAVQQLREIHFDYRRPNSVEVTRRQVQPWGLSSVRGHWYLTGLDLGRGEQRVFRLSRVVGSVRLHGKPGAYSVPAGARPADVAWPSERRDQPVSAEVEVRTGAGARLRRSAQVIQESDGWTRLRVSGLPWGVLVSDLATLLDSARAIDPPEVADAVAGHLSAVVAAHTREDLDQLAAVASSALDEARARGSRRHGMIEPATERLSRLLAMVPWLVHRQGIDLTAAADGLGVSEDQLRADLDLLFMCGYGSMPDELIEVESEGGQIFIRNAEAIARPLRLGWDEAVTLLVGLRALAGVPGLHDDDAVSRALAKLEQAAGDLAATADRITARIDVGVDAELLATLRGALADRRRVHLVYEGAERDERTERDVDLMRVVTADGRWYVEGWCHRARDTRFFRLDRIRSATVLDVDGTPPAEASARDLSAGAYQPAPGALTVTLALAPAARWVSEYYPIEAHAEIGETEVSAGTSSGPLDVVRLQISHPDWLTRLVVRLGGEAVLLSPSDLRESVVARAERALMGHHTGPLDAMSSDPPGTLP